LLTSTGTSKINNKHKLEKAVEGDRFLSAKSAIAWSRLYQIEKRILKMEAPPKSELKSDQMQECSFAFPKLRVRQGAGGIYPQSSKAAS
jgi:hypothetical protein